MHLLPVTFQRGKAEIYRRSGLVTPCEQRLLYDASFTVPVLSSCGRAEKLAVLVAQPGFIRTHVGMYV